MITNRHVIEDGVSFRVEHSGEKWPAKLIGIDPDHDLVELSVAGLVAPAVHVRNSSTLAVGEKVYAIGAPEGLELTISEGLISGLRDLGQSEVIQTSAAISPGSSGGGLFDAQGRLVGITTFYLKEGQSLNFALPAEWTLALDNQPRRATPASGENTPAFQALVWFELGISDLFAGKADAAVGALTEAVRLEPSDVGAWMDLAVAYNMLGQPNKALGAAEKAVRLKPKLASAWTSLGTAYGTLGQLDRAVTAEQEAIRLNPHDEAAWVNLSATFGELGRYDEQVSAAEEALRLRRDDELAWRNLGAAYGNLGRYDKAVNAEQAALRLKPDDANAWYALGLACGRLGQRSEVIKIYEKLKTLDPNLADKFFKEDVLP